MKVGGLRLKSLKDNAQFGGGGPPTMQQVWEPGTADENGGVRRPRPMPTLPRILNVLEYKRKDRKDLWKVVFDDEETSFEEMSTIVENAAEPKLIDKAKQLKAEKGKLWWDNLSVL